MTNRIQQDVLLTQTIALAAAAGSVYTTGIDLMNSAAGDFVAPVEFHVTAPALTTTHLPDTETMVYVVQTDTDVAFGSPTDLFTVITQTGAGGAGAAAAAATFALPSGTERYLRLKITGSTSIGNCSAVSGILTPKF